MKFFNIIPLSSFRLEYSAFLCDAPSTLGPFHQLYYHYSMLRTQLPRNASPNIFSPILGILSVALWMFSLLIASLSYLYSVMVDILYACAHDPYSPPPLVSSHSRYYISESANHDIVSEHPLLIHDNDTWSPILYERLANLQYVNPFEILPYRKFITFIETEVAAMNCGDSTLF